MKKIYYSYDFLQDPAWYNRDSYIQLDGIDGGISYHFQLITAKPTFIRQENHESFRLPESAFLGVGKMKHKAKRTHFIADRHNLESVYNCYMIVSKEMIIKFKSLNLGESKAYSLPILHRKKLYEYFLLVVQNPVESIQNAGGLLPDIISVKVGIYNIPYFSEKANDLIKNEIDLGLVFKEAKEF